MSENAGNTTMNGTQPSSCSINPTAEKNWNDPCILSHLHCFIGWEHRHRNNCLEDENHEKTHQLFHCEHGHVRSVSSDFPDP